MTTSQLTELQAQMKEAARELLQLSQALKPRAGANEHIKHAAQALAVLRFGDVSKTFCTDYVCEEVAKEEGIN